MLPPPNVIYLDAGAAATGSGAACTGDLGGPLVTKTTGDAGFTLVGVIGQVSCDKTSTASSLNIPSVHTEVKPYLDWITTEAKNLIDMS